MKLPPVERFRIQSKSGGCDGREEKHSVVILFAVVSAVAFCLVTDITPQFSKRPECPNVCCILAPLSLGMGKGEVQA